MRRREPAVAPGSQCGSRKGWLPEGRDKQGCRWGGEAAGGSGERWQIGEGKFAIPGAHFQAPI